MSSSFTLASSPTVFEISKKTPEKYPGLGDLEINFAAVQNMQDLTSVMCLSLSPLIDIDHFFCLLENHERSFTCFIYLKKDDKGNLVLTDQCEQVKVEKDIIEQTIASPDPLLWSRGDTSEKGPDFTFPSRSAVRYIAGFHLLVNKKQKGVFFMCLERGECFSPVELELIKNLSQSLSLALSHVMNEQRSDLLRFECGKLLDSSIRERESESALLLSLSNDIATVRTTDNLNKIIGKTLKNIFQIEQYIVSIRKDKEDSHSYILVEPRSAYFKELGFDINSENESPIKGSIAQPIFDTDGTGVFPFSTLLAKRNHIRPDVFFKLVMENNRGYAVPLRAGDTNIGILWVYSFKKIDERLLKNITAQIAVALANAVANEKIEKQFVEINHYKLMLETENLYLQSEIQTSGNYNEIIGQGSGMRNVFQLVAQVSESESSVLLLGETGTGKELIARAIHSSSPRKDKLMIKINCATLPPNLIESELFGHERGSFTGATEKRIGKFELANRSTIFLDEIGELSLELQVKLLRVLQEKEFERVGGRQVIKTDVRVIAATNRDLKKEVAAGNFRRDLYFRLDVFPITIPPLRERKEDIPKLAEYFLIKHANPRNKVNLVISSRVMKQFMAYDWPGNVRELEHMVERSILLTDGATIAAVNLPVTDEGESNVLYQNSRLKTLEENERDHIIVVLKKCNSQVAGIGGAAEILGLPSTTLNSRIRKLKIKKGFMND